MRERRELPRGLHVNVLCQETERHLSSPEIWKTTPPRRAVGPPRLQRIEPFTRARPASIGGPRWKSAIRSAHSRSNRSRTRSQPRAPSFQLKSRSKVLSSQSASPPSDTALHRDVSCRAVPLTSRRLAG